MLIKTGNPNLFYSHDFLCLNLMNGFEKTFSKFSSETLLKRHETAVILLTMVQCYATHYLMAYNDGVGINILMIKVKILFSAPLPNFNSCYYNSMKTRYRFPIKAWVGIEVNRG